MNVAVARLDIDGLEGLEAAIASGTIEPTQISLRRPKGRIIAADLGTSLLTNGKTDADYSVAGVFSEDSLTFGMFLESDDSHIFASDGEAGDFGIFPASTEHAARHRGNLEYLVMTIDPVRLRQLADSEGIHFDRQILTHRGMYRPSIEWAAYSVAFAKGICSTLAALNPLLCGPSKAARATRKIMADDMTRLFLHAMAQTDGASLEEKPICLLGQKLVAEARKLLLRDDMDKALCVDQLASQFSVSRRTLYRAFKSQLGMSPAKYLKFYRHSRVHLELLHSTPEDASVSKIALGWGFGDLGRFAGEYRQLFGQFPSETLASQ